MSGSSTGGAGGGGGGGASGTGGGANGTETAQPTAIPNAGGKVVVSAGVAVAWGVAAVFVL